MKKKKELEKVVLYVSTWWMFVITCGLFPPATRNEQQYDVWEDKNWILHIRSNTFHYYEIQEDVQGKLRFYIETEFEHFAYCYIDTNMMVLTVDSLNHSEKYREMFDVLFDYYEESFFEVVENTDNV